MGNSPPTQGEASAYAETASDMAKTKSSPTAHTKSNEACATEAGPTMPTRKFTRKSTVMTFGASDKTPLLTSPMSTDSVGLDAVGTSSMLAHDAPNDPTYMLQLASSIHTASPMSAGTVGPDTAGTSSMTDHGTANHDKKMTLDQRFSKTEAPNIDTLARLARSATSTSADLIGSDEDGASLSRAPPRPRLSERFGSMHHGKTITLNERIGTLDEQENLNKAQSRWPLNGWTAIPTLTSAKEHTDASVDRGRFDNVAILHVGNRRILLVDPAPSNPEFANVKMTAAAVQQLADEQATCHDQLRCAEEADQA